MYSRKVLIVAIRGLSLLWALGLAFVLHPAIALPESKPSDMPANNARMLENGQSYLVGWPTRANHAYPLAASSTTMSASKDNTLYESSSGSLSNGAGEHFFVGRNDDGKIRRAVIAFDIADNIPAGSTVTDVALVLHMSRSHADEVSIELRRLLTDWGEGSSNAPDNEGGGTSAAPGDATWLHTFYNTSFWTNTGGDFSAVASATASVGGIGSYTWESTPQMVADVQAWLDTPATSFGWLLLGNEAKSQTTKRFDTRENANPSNRPALIVEYLVPPTLTANYASGAPGSFFTFTGANFSTSSAATVTVNGQMLGTVPTDGSGNLVFLLSTTNADKGSYVARATVNSSAAAGFVLDSDEPVRPQDGSGPVFDVPPGIALTELVYLPILLR